jgi:hypothetical protein
MWSMLEASYAAAGLDPDTYLVVTQGAYKAGGGAAASGSTHDAGGAADLRTWNLPGSAQADLCRAVVVELRRRGGCAWYRDQAHGGMDPHIHVILRDEPGLSSGAASQVRDYDAGRNGLSNKGPDYHPRPDQHPYTYPPEDDMPLSDDDVKRIARAVWSHDVDPSGGSYSAGGALWTALGRTALLNDMASRVWSFTKRTLTG